MRRRIDTGLAGSAMNLRSTEKPDSPTGGRTREFTDVPSVILSHNKGEGSDCMSPTTSLLHTNASFA